MKLVWVKAREGLSIGLAGKANLFQFYPFLMTDPHAESPWAVW